MIREHKSIGPLRGLAEDVARGARAEAVFGAPVEHGGVLVIPVARARFGFGGGGGRSGGREVGEGGGGGAVVRPAGYIEMRKGRARFRRITTASDIGAVALALALVALSWRVVWPRLRSDVDADLRDRTGDGVADQPGG